MTNLITSTWNWWLFGALLLLVSLGAVGAALVPGSGSPADDSAQVEVPDGHSGGPSTLPPGTAVFADRESELGRILNAQPPAAGPRPLVCLVTGPPGSGKTELAVQAAHRLAVRYPSGQLFVGYRSNAPEAGRLLVEDALAALLAAVGAAAGTTQFDPRSMTSQWLNTANNRPFLIVLDDVNRADQVDPLLPGSPRSMVIVTSRTMLTGLDADVHIEVDALSEDGARSVVTAILRRGSRTVDDTVIDAVVAAQYRLPLTIRHIADRIVAERTPIALRAEPPIPVSSAGTEPMLAAIEALAPVDHLVFRRMALHPGPHVTAEIAAVLADVSLPEAEGALALLHEHGLILRPDPHGYGLHDLVRSLAHRECNLRDGTCAQARERLFTWAADQLVRANDGIHAPLHLGEPQATMNEEQALQWLHRYFEDLRSVARLAIDNAWPESWRLTAGLAYYMRVKKRNIHQAIGLNEAALRFAPASDEAGKAHCQAQLAALHRVSGEYGEALEQAEEATEAFIRLGDRCNQAYAAAEVGMNQYHLSHYTSARETMARAVELHQSEGQPRGTANGLGVLGLIKRATGNYREAREHLREALTLYRRIQNHRNEAWILIELGVIDRLTGKLRRAEARFNAALRINTRLQDGNGCAWARREIGILKRIRGQYDEARTLLEDALREFEALESQRNIADAEVELCSLHRALGETRTAFGYGEEALQRYERMRNRRGGAWTKIELGALDAVRGAFDLADSKFKEARRTYQEIGDPSGEARANLELGRLKLSRGQDAAARPYLVRARDLYTELGAPQAAEVRSLLDGE
ncbi:tetratricopeptide repeat protein [Streptomyces sp. NPDC048258]|uniref:tetratricopeptide repeat protein n=1 Tax=Streptomyces sp. NPDC048258 TaxID=3365527 RepID=UPI00371B273B